MRREIYGRGEYVAPSPWQIVEVEAVAKCIGRLLESYWWLPDRLDSFARNRLVDAVSNALRQ